MSKAFVERDLRLLPSGPGLRLAVTLAAAGFGAGAGYVLFGRAQVEEYGLVLPAVVLGCLVVSAIALYVSDRRQRRFDAESSTARRELGAALRISRNLSRELDARPDGTGDRTP